MKRAGWGGYPWIEATEHRFETGEQLVSILPHVQNGIVYAKGRSYGDSALAEQLILTDRFNNFLSFDARTGLLVCQSGVSLAEIIDVFLPRGWFLSTTPGTKLISVGGAIASDVHGKNHHKAGCFSSSIQELELMLPDGKVQRCSRDKNPELFRATCGGMGLTGVILTAQLKLQPVKSALMRQTVIACRDLTSILEAFDTHAEFSYSVAWIDCLSQGKHLGRSVLFLGEHAQSGSLRPPRIQNRSIPFNFPAFCLNRYTVSLFNRMYYSKNASYMKDALIDLNTFFYPLDAIGNWNRMYGRHGFTQYQLVLPKSASHRGLKTILERIADSGLGSFLAVLKLFGPQNDNWLSFPLEGYTLALDFKIEKKLFPLLDELDRIVLDHGGRLYLTKDVRMPKSVFQQGYPNWQKFADFRRSLGLQEKFNSLQSRRLGV